MKICAAQTRPIPGDVSGNIIAHQRLIELAAARGAEVIIFPELSLTGYEPTLARELALRPGDPRLEIFQKLSDSKGIRIGIGAPTTSESGLHISLLLFQPRQPQRIYSKTYLHADEEPFFVPGQNSPHWQMADARLALAICYEISVADHLHTALQNHPEIYVASVAKFARGIDQALERLANIAREHSLIVLMANSVGPADGNECAGRTSIWNRRGELLGQLDGTHEGILMIDTETEEMTEAARSLHPRP
jgi:predicted amidohydrolase